MANSILNRKPSLLVEVMRLASQTRTVEDLDFLLEGPLKELLRYEAVICGIGFTAESGCFGHKYHSRGYPQKYFFELEQPGGSVDSPLMQLWRSSLKPVYFQSGRDDGKLPPEWVKAFNKYDLRNTVAHATVDRAGIVANYFIFARLEGEVGDEHAEILELLIPNLGQALSVALHAQECDPDFAGTAQNLVSKRQCEILHWIYHGKTNWEISKILEMNEENIKYHVEQAMSKLKVKTRAQAVGRALELGLIADIGKSR